jgi:hypothetical protein
VVQTSELRSNARSAGSTRYPKAAKPREGTTRMRASNSDSRTSGYRAPAERPPERCRIRRATRHAPAVSNTDAGDDAERRQRLDAPTRARRKDSPSLPSTVTSIARQKDGVGLAFRSSPSPEVKTRCACRRDKPQLRSTVGQ